MTDMPEVSFTCAACGEPALTPAALPAYCDGGRYWHEACWNREHPGRPLAATPVNGDAPGLPEGGGS